MQPSVTRARTMEASSTVSENKMDNAVLKFLFCSERETGRANCLSSKAGHYPVGALSLRHARAGQLNINTRLEPLEWEPLELLAGGSWQGQEAETAIRPLTSQHIHRQREGKDTGFHCLFFMGGSFIVRWF